MICRVLAVSLLLPAAALALPAPGTLGGCAAPGPVAAEMEQMAATLHGRALGCFQSGETLELRGAGPPHAVPVEYAFAVEMTNRRYSQLDLDNLMAEVRDQWKGSDSLSQDTRADYDRRIDQLIEPAGPRTAQPRAAPKPPVLVSIERPDDNYQTIVSIVRRQVSVDGEYFDTTRLDAAAVVFKNATLIRLSLARELRSKGDVGAIRQEIADWAAAVAASQ